MGRRLVNVVIFRRTFFIFILDSYTKVSQIVKTLSVEVVTHNFFPYLCSRTSPCAGRFLFLMLNNNTNNGIQF